MINKNIVSVIAVVVGVLILIISGLIIKQVFFNRYIKEITLVDNF